MLRPRLALSILALLAGCQEWPEVKPCGQIPPDGCPIGRGGTCEDRACAGLYDCIEGQWIQVQSCPAVDGGGGGGGGSGADAGVDACSPITFDHTGEVLGCTPDLQNPPDCPAAAAEGCAEAACLTGCTDFWICMKDGWEGVAYCTEEGQIVILQ
jgi:hypothetical protein